MDEKHVAEWLTSKSYSSKLNMSAWDFVDGPTLLDLNVESCKTLQIPPALIPRLLKDIKSLARTSEEKVIDLNTTETRITVMGTMNGTVISEHSEALKELSGKISTMNHRNRIRDFSKEFEGSLFRIIVIMILTYAVLSTYMLLADLDRPWISAIVPTVGFQLSTVSLPSIKNCYVEHRLKTLKA